MPLNLRGVMCLITSQNATAPKRDWLQLTGSDSLITSQNATASQNKDLVLNVPFGTPRRWLS